MNTSISLSGPSRSKRMVEAGRGTTASAGMIKSLLLTRRAGLQLQVRAPVDPRHPRQQVIHFGLCLFGEARPRLALRAASDHAALLQHIFPHRQSRTRLLLVADQRQMRVEQIMRGVA